MYIINADDFGLSAEVNQAITTCFRKGLINRTTIMVNMPYAEAAAEAARKYGFFGAVGLHINLAEGPALTKICRENRLLCDEKGFFNGTFHLKLINRFFVDHACLEALSAEVEAQIQKYMDMGFTLMHADSHRYIHTYYSVARVVHPLLMKYGFRSMRISRNLPGDDLSPLVAAYKSFYNRRARLLKGISTTEFFGSMDDFLSSPQKTDTEIMVHPVMKNGVLMDDTLPDPKPFFTKDFLMEKGIRLEAVDQNRRRLLVVFQEPHIGGSMTALMNFLNTIDPQMYDVDLAMNTFSEKQPVMPDHVTLLEAVKGPPPAKWRLFSFLVWLYMKFCVHYRLNLLPAEQLQLQLECRSARKLTKEYDAVLAYELNWCMYYAAKHVKAEHKIVLVHNDYHSFGYCYLFDRRFFRQMDALAFVSKECMHGFLDRHPVYRSKAYYMPNVTSQKTVFERAAAPMKLNLPEKKESVLRLITIARVSFPAKGIDRMINVCLRLRQEGLLERLCWVVMGGGEDLKKFRRMISENQLEKNIYAMGFVDNPLPYLKRFHGMLLPSRNEGKPMAVTEAQIMSVPPVVTRYASAEGQIENGVDGLIFDNDDEALYQGIRSLILHPEMLQNIACAMQSRCYSTETDIRYFYQMMDELCG